MNSPWITLETKDGPVSVSEWSVVQVERDGYVLVIDAGFVEIGEVAWVVKTDVWGMRVL